MTLLEVGWKLWAFRIAALTVVLATVDAFWIEPRWIKTVHLDLSGAEEPIRLVHITDIHHKGDAAYFQKVVGKVNSLRPDLVCFTGDLVERERHMGPALELLSGIEAPVFAVPGNHDYWCGYSMEAMSAGMKQWGGRVLINEWAVFEKGGRTVIIAGLDDVWAGHPEPGAVLPEARDRAGSTLVVMSHSPAGFALLEGARFDLGLCGHSHGGQVRLPLVGALRLPRYVGEYEMGPYQTDSGPIYVNPGLGLLWPPVRFMCRPQIVCVEL